MNQTCPSCNATIPADVYFCPNCGKKLREKPQSTGIGRQIVVYFISVLLPPLGYWYGYKYLRQEEAKSKWIGIAAIVLTTISLVYTIWLTQQLVSSFNRTLNSQLNGYQNLGY